MAGDGQNSGQDSKAKLWEQNYQVVTNMIVLRLVDMLLTEAYSSFGVGGEPRLALLHFISFLQTLFSMQHRGMTIGACRTASIAASTSSSDFKVVPSISWPWVTFNHLTSALLMRGKTPKHVTCSRLGVDKTTTYDLWYC
jgi:hypothetical protein